MDKAFGRILALAGFLALATGLFPAKMEACEICHRPWILRFHAWCHPVEDGQTGVTNCKDSVDPLTGVISCSEEGIFCSVVSAGGGGGGGSAGGGGGDACVGTYNCPAECFSCTRPAF